MSLPASQQRALNQIEKALADDHPGLGPLFAIFARLVGHEAMPVTERLTGQPWRWQRRMPPAVVALVGLAMVTGALFMLSLRLSGPPACPGTVTAVAPRTPYVPAGHQPACAPQQAKPSQSAHHAG